MNRPTPETDAELYPMNGVDIVWPDFARQLERERDEAREIASELAILRAFSELVYEGKNKVNKLTPETDAAVSVGLENADRECVPADFARQLERERDEARDALMKIEEVFIDSDDTYEDWRKMGNIARSALGSKK